MLKEIIAATNDKGGVDKTTTTKGLNIPLPLSIYKRLSTMKIDSDAESLKSLGLKAIIEFLDKNKY